MRPALFVVALVLYAWTCPPGASWLDSSELAGAGATLGIPHAPGHPLYVVLAHAASLVPLGPVGFRVSLLSALLGALAVLLAHDLARDVSRRVAGTRAPAWPAWSCAVVLALGQGLWLQSNRAEVYSLQLALHLWLLREAIRFSLDGAVGTSPPRLALAAFAIGLGAGNHHLLLAALLPALLLLVLGTDEGRRTFTRALPGALALGLFGLLVYALLPLRARLDPVFDYGDPRTAGRLLDVVTAKVFQRSVEGASAPLAANLDGAVALAMLSIGPILLFLGPIGLAIVARRRPLLGLGLALAVAGSFATKLLMVLDPTNPDDFGYVATGIAVLAALAAAALATLAAAPSFEVPLAKWSPAVVLLLVGTSLVQVTSSGDRLDMRRQRSPEAVDLLLQGHLLPGAVVLPSFYALLFDRLYQRAAEGARPDVVAFHQGFEDHVGGGRPLAERLRRRDPELGAVFDAFLASGSFPAAALEDLARTRPVYVEPTLSLPLPAERLGWAGGFFRLLPRGVPAPGDADRQAADQASLLRAVGAELATKREARTTATLLTLEVAVVRLQQGSAAGGTLALDLADRLAGGRSPYADRLRPMVDALDGIGRTSPDALAEVRRRIAATDFRGLFEAPAARASEPP